MAFKIMGHPEAQAELLGVHAPDFPVLGTRFAFLAQGSVSGHALDHVQLHISDRNVRKWLQRSLELR